MNKARRARIQNAASILTSIKTDLEEVHSEEEDVFDNVPENLQGSQRYEDMEAALESLQDAISSIDDAIDSLEEIQA